MNGSYYIHTIVKEVLRLETAIDILADVMPFWGWGIYFLGAAAVFLLCQRFVRSCPARKAALINYLVFVLLITLLTRTQKPHSAAAWQPLWSWHKVILHGNRRLFEEIVLNLLMLLPVGMLTASIYRKKQLKHAFCIGIVLSSAIEVSQLVLRLGLFEWDDIIHNTLGCILGAGIVCAVQNLQKKRAANTGHKPS